MEIRIGIQHSPREVVVETREEESELSSRVEHALSSGTALRLTDEKGRVVLVPGDKIAFAEISTEEPRRVGFLG